MKKYLKLFVAVITTLVLSTGCVKYETTMTINNDYSLNYATIVGYKKADIISSGSDLDTVKEENKIDEEQTKEYKKLGITVADYEDDEVIGLKLVKKFESIDDLTNEIDTSCELDLYNKNVENQYCFKRVKGFFFDTYKAKINAKTYTEGLNSNNTTNDETDPEEKFKKDNNITDDKYDRVPSDDGETIAFVPKDGGTQILYIPSLYNNETTQQLTNTVSSAMKDASIKFILNTSVKINNANATKVEDNKYIWDFSDNKNIEYIEFEVTRPNYLYIGLAIGVGVLVLLLIIGIIGGTILKHKENKKNKDIKDNLTTVAPETVQAEVNPVVNALLSPDGNDLNNIENK